MATVFFHQEEEKILFTFLLHTNTHKKSATKYGWKVTTYLKIHILKSRLKTEIHMERIL